MAYGKALQLKYTEELQKEKQRKRKNKQYRKDLNNHTNDNK